MKISQATVPTGRLFYVHRMGRDMISRARFMDVTGPKNSCHYGREIRRYRDGVLDIVVEPGNSKEDSDVTRILPSACAYCRTSGPCQVHGTRTRMPSERIDAANGSEYGSVRRWQESDRYACSPGGYRVTIRSSRCPRIMRAEDCSTLLSWRFDVRIDLVC